MNLHSKRISRGRQYRVYLPIITYQSRGLACTLQSLPIQAQTALAVKVPTPLFRSWQMAERSADFPRIRNRGPEWLPRGGSDPRNLHAKGGSCLRRLPISKLATAAHSPGIARQGKGDGALSYVIMFVLVLFHYCIYIDQSTLPTFYVCVLFVFYMSCVKVGSDLSHGSPHTYSAAVPGPGCRLSMVYRYLTP